VKKRRVRHADGGRQGHHTHARAHTTHRVEGPCGRVLELVGAADGFGEGEQEVVVLLRARRDLLAGIERFLNNKVVVVSTASCGVCVSLRATRWCRTVSSFRPSAVESLAMSMAVARLTVSTHCGA
jgi:hypothetical protein